MKRPTSFLFATLLLGVLAFLFLGSITIEAPAAPASTADSTDILEAVRALQKAMPAPPTTFRSGHVSPREIEDYLHKKEEGFVIQLPAQSLTPSPTLYKGTLYVSGGFGSKAFYAFNATTGAVQWALTLDDDGPTSAVIEDDIVVFNTESCTIFAVEAATGALLWSHYLGDPLMSTPSIAAGKVFTAYPAGGSSVLVQQTPSDQQTEEQQIGASTLRATHVFIALDLKTGTVLWQKWIDGDIMSAPVVEADDLYVTTFPGTLYKFDPDTGEILAAHASRATSAPVVVGDSVYMSRRADAGGVVRESISVMGGKMAGATHSYYAKDAPYLDADVQNDSELKEAAGNYDAFNGFAGGLPASAGLDEVIVVGQSNVSSLQAFQGSRVLHLYGKNYATMGDELIATDAVNGAVLWKQSLHGDLRKSGGFLATPPLSVGGKIIIATLEGDLVLSDAETGEELQRFSTGEQIRYQPVVEAGHLYVSTVQGNVFHIDTGDATLTGWPTWGANAAHTNRVAFR